MLRMRASSLCAAGALLLAATAAPLTFTPAPAAPASTASAVAPQPHLVSSAYGYGTRIASGRLPVRSDATAEAWLGCRSFAPRKVVEDQASVRVPGLGTVDAATTRLWSTEGGKVASTYGRHHTAKITLLKTPAGTLMIRGLTTRVRAFWTGSRFKTESSGEIASVELKPVTGPAISFPVPVSGRSLTVPGVATLKWGETRSSVQPHEAFVARTGLVVTAHATHTSVHLGRVSARLGVREVMGRFAGRASGVRGSLVAEVIGVGATPNTPLRCQGTGGVLERRAIAGVDLGALDVDALTTERRAWQRGRARHAEMSGAVGCVELADGDVVIRAIKGEARVVRRGDLVQRATTARIASIRVNGRSVELANGESLRVPGVATLERKIVTRLPRGVEVTALRITLLDGTGAVIDLGNARVSTP